MEKWKTLSFNDRYLISNYGKIRSNRGTRKFINGSKNTANVRSIYIFYQGIRKSYPIKNLVYSEFIGQIPEGYLVYTKDNNEDNLNVENLIALPKNIAIFLKVTKNGKLVKQCSHKKYTYIVDGVNVGKLNEFVKFIPNQTRANISRRFKEWEESTRRDEDGVKFGQHWCKRQIDYIKDERYERLINYLNTVKELDNGR